MSTEQFGPFPGTDALMGATEYHVFRSLLEKSECRRCALWENRTSIVVDRGDPGAHIMAVGEAPGEKEDVQGRAFVGRAGRLLDRLLLEAGIAPERDVLIANVVKCRPPGNRQPTREEAGTCLPYLHRQIELVRPHTVLLLGATAVRHLLRGRAAFSMKERVGKVFTSPDHPGREFVALYHPAYLLRDPRKEPLFLEHLRSLREHLESAGRWPRGPS